MGVFLIFYFFPYDLIADAYPVLGLLEDILLLAVSLLGCIDARVKVLAEFKAHQLLSKTGATKEH